MDFDLKAITCHIRNGAHHLEGIQCIQVFNDEPSGVRIGLKRRGGSWTLCAFSVGAGGCYVWNMSPMEGFYFCPSCLPLEFVGQTPQIKIALTTQDAYYIVRNNTDFERHTKHVRF